MNEIASHNEVEYFNLLRSRTKIRHGLTALFGLTIFSAMPGPVAAVTPPAQSAECATAGRCLAAFSADLDGDEAPDRVELVYEGRLRLYNVIVHTKTGRFYRPFVGSLDPEKETVSLTLRSGGGDKRCRSWVSGRYCGYVMRGDVPPNVLYLSHSRHGDFVLFMNFQDSHRTHEPGGSPRKDGFFLVMPALEGDPSDNPYPEIGRP